MPLRAYPTSHASKISQPEKPSDVKTKQDKPYIIEIERVSDGFYSYFVRLLARRDGEVYEELDSEAAGDCFYWGLPDWECPGVDEAIKMILKRNGLTINDVRIHRCGWFEEDGCYYT